MGDSGVGKSAIIQLLKNQKDIVKSNPLIDYHFVLGQSQNEVIKLIKGF